MAIRFRRFKEISKLVPKFYSGFNGNYQLSRGGIDCHFHECLRSNKKFEWRNFHHFRRYSTLPKILNEPLPEADFLSFIRSSLDEHEGCSYRWLNVSWGSRSFFKKDGIFLIVAGEYIGDSLVSGYNSSSMFEKVKSLQQRYPSLQVMGFIYSPTISLDAVGTNLLRRIMAEYITFPILLSDKCHPQVKDGACYIMFKGVESPLIYHEGIDLATLDKAVKILTTDQGEIPRLVNKLDSTWANRIQIVKEPFHCLSLRNLLFYFPGCVSADEGGNRLFLSDSNHHRIIIFDISGKILDSIGSSPGFEDAEFENAKLMRPAASFYHACEDCLYFVDSENHAIRRADLGRKVVETIYPTNASKKNTSIWSWVLDKLWTEREVDTKSEEFHSNSLLFPWHLVKSTNNDLFVLNRSFGTLWIMDLASGIIKEVVKGFPKVLEICGEMIMEKSSVLKRIPNDLLQQQLDMTCLLDGIPHSSLLSSVAKFRDDLVFCDTVGQMVFKLNGNSGSLSSYQFSNFGVLGLPYWFSFPLERVFALDDVLSDMHIDHTEAFSLLPGRVNILMKIMIPENMDLVEPPDRSSIWCQARGTAMEVSGTESKANSSEKVGVAQQWYDEIDHLAFTSSEAGPNTAVETTTSNSLMNDGRICFDCTIATSPGTSEIIIYAPLYLRLTRSSSSRTDDRVENAARIADILDPLRRPSRDSVIQFLLSSKRDLEKLVFVKPLHVRLKFESADHPKADNSKGVVLTDSSVEVNVAL
ncbi:hypothetical protein ACH5RR_020376 [Cinchona calisaya]|uniref:NHL domain-containing protein n=1 Tax=Cinchona calisaya TaxID=153742 RepID=A0ABD2ZI35_9GENT